ncbi:MAG TPA: basic secretory protein-like protein [Phycisphaerales bacterium]|nr:basic secretory protein-like protein [Phycisphaerales bacterium]
MTMKSHFFTGSLVLAAVVCSLAIAEPPATAPATRPDIDHATDKALGHGFVINLEVTDAPQLLEWGEKARAICEKQYPIICEMLNSDGFVPVEQIKIVFRKSMSVPAATGGGIITINAEYVENHKSDFGMVVHELTHVVQSYPRINSNMSWLTEGIADYIRFYKYEPGADKSVIDVKKASYRDSYRTTAAFLNYLTESRDKDIVKKLNALMRQGQCNKISFKTRLGRSIDDLWKDFIEVEKKRQAAG